MGEDMIFTLEYLSMIDNYALISETGYIYRKHDNSATASNNTDFQYSYLYYQTYKLMYNRYRKSHNINSRTLRDVQSACLLFESLFSLNKTTTLKNGAAIIKNLLNNEDRDILRCYKGHSIKKALTWILRAKYYVLFSLSCKLINSFK